VEGAIIGIGVVVFVVMIVVAVYIVKRKNQPSTEQV